MAPAVQAASLQLTPASWPRLKAWLPSSSCPCEHTWPQPSSFRERLCDCGYFVYLSCMSDLDAQACNWSLSRAWTQPKANILTSKLIPLALFRFPLLSLLLRLMQSDMQCKFTCRSCCQFSKMWLTIWDGCSLGLWLTLDFIKCVSRQQTHSNDTQSQINMYTQCTLYSHATLTEPFIGCYGSRIRLFPKWALRHLHTWVQRTIN